MTQKRLALTGIAAAVALVLGGVGYSNLSGDAHLSAGSPGPGAAGGRAGAQDSAAARRARQQWLSTVTPPKAVVPANQSSIAAAVRDKRKLVLQSGVFDPVDPQQNVPNAGVSVSEQYAIVQFGEGTRDQRAVLEQSGAKILGYVPNNAYLVRAGDSGIAALQNLKGVRWAGGYRSDMKLAADLLRTAQKFDQSSNGQTQIELNLFTQENAHSTAKDLLTGLPGAKLLQVFGDVESPMVRMQVPNALLAQALAQASKVDAIEHIARYFPPVLKNTATIPVLQSNYAPPVGTSEPGVGRIAGATPLWDQGLVGSGQIVGIMDGILDYNEAWFTYHRKNNEEPVQAITASVEIPRPGDNEEIIPGTLYPNNKVIGLWVKPGETSEDYIDSHGTHVAGIVAGDLAGEFGDALYSASTTDHAEHDSADGLAPNAQILFQSLSLGNGPSNGSTADKYPLQKIFRQAYRGGARIHSDSWGYWQKGDYANSARLTDKAAYETEDMLIVFAAGNEGQDRKNDKVDEDDNPATTRCPDDQWRGGYCWTSVSSPGPAKNNVSVAALEHGSSLNVAGFSSRGTIDGRFKPDIAAPGTAIISAKAQKSTGVTTASYTPTTRSMSGTSMATPAIAASAALVRQYFTDGFYPSGQRTAADRIAPSGPMLKAVLLNSTRPVKDPANAFSSINQGANDWPILGGGWGRPWLDSNLWFQRTTLGGNDSRRLRMFERSNASGLRTDEQHEYAITAVRAGEELRVTLTWYDPPASTLAAVALVNDLDLEVEGPDGRVYRGNSLVEGVSKEFCTRERYNQMRNTTARCRQAGPNDADALNNVEQIRLTAPTAGHYKLRVKGSYVPGTDLVGSDRQGYALVVSGAFGPAQGKAQLAAPTGVRVANRVALPTPSATVQFSAVANATGYQLYRLEGGCTAETTAKSYRLVAHQSADQGLTLVDSLIDDGKNYGYAVRAIGGDVEGRVSQCVTSASTAVANATPEIPCTNLIEQQQSCRVEAESSRAKYQQCMNNHALWLRDQGLISNDEVVGVRQCVAQQSLAQN